MDFYGLDRGRAIANCDSAALGRAGRDVASVRAWNRIHPEHVVDLLDQASWDARGDANMLATRLSRMPWRIQQASAPTHSANRLVSNTREVVVTAGARSFVLHCTESPSLTLERITT
ncbi:hypothetical protein [Luteimonas terrae]|uniref:Uncharacterized protein n=1 Tax=Luteimonas terrae TaxID=1530191 RepID=A0ABU1XV87_9GAMM|nr:hypothetical protein [Luteimonas terrae]MDR7192653.1 hypothetical protein [Luteimonas terrae]